MKKSIKIFAVSGGILMGGGIIAVLICAVSFDASITAYLQPYFMGSIVVGMILLIVAVFSRRGIR